MLVQWATISAAVIPHLKKYATEKAAKLGENYADSKLAQLYKRVVPDQKLIKAVEAFVIRFDKELDSAADVPTLTLPAYQSALPAFLGDPDVLEALETPLDAQSDLDWDFLSRRWTYLRSPDGKPLISLPGDFDWSKLAKRYCEAVRNQALANPELRPIIEASATLRMAKAAEQTASALSRLAGPATSFDLACYAESLKDLYRYLRLGSLDPDWAVYENRVHLENVYVPQSAKQALPPRDLTRDYLRKLKSRETQLAPEEELLKEKTIYESLKATPILTVVDEPANNHLVILGDPGLGKSTLLKYLALRSADDQSRPPAFLLELRRTVDQAGKIDFLAYMEEGRGQTARLPRMELNEYLKQNQSLFLYDGLDEVLEGLRSNVVSAIISFAREYTKARIVVTTRIHGYHPGSSHPEQFRNAQFQQFTLQDFSQEEIDRFVAIWHKEAFLKEDDRLRYEERLKQAIGDSPAIRELAANPLLLTMMAILNRVQDLPRDRGRLYERCAELLLKNWDLEKFPERITRRDTRDIKDKLGPDQKMRILELVASAMQEERTGLEGNIIAEKKLKEIVEKQLSELEVPQPWSVAEDLIAMLRERNFMLAYLGDHQYAFVHRTFLEYFVARDLKYRLEKTSSFSIDQLEAVFRERWARDEWQEILRLLSGMIGPEYAAKCIGELLNVDGAVPNYEGAIFLAADCLQEVRELGGIRELRAAVREALMQVIGVDTRSAEKVEALMKVMAAQQKAARLLVRGWKEEPGTLEWLKEQVDKDTKISTSSIALSEIVRSWSSEEWLLPWLKRYASKGVSALLRTTTLMLLAEIWREQWVWELLKEGSLDENPAIQAISEWTLLTYFRSWPGTMEFLKQAILQTGNSKSLSLFTSGLMLKGDPEAMRWLQDIANESSDPATRKEAIMQLQRALPQPDLDRWFKKVSEEDADLEVRKVAADAIN